MSRHDVLVVGAGPTGLTMAALLAARGVAVRVVDKAAARTRESRALAVQPRSLETLRRLGVAERLIERGQVVRSVRVWVGGRVAGRLDLSDLGYDDTPYPFPLFVSQAVTEEVLEARLGELGVAVERSTELVSLGQTYDGVTAELTGPGGRETVGTGWLVGCDGAHSRVRKELGLEFAGAPYEQDFVLADVTVEWGEDGDRLQIFVSRRGLLAVFPFAGQGFARLIATRAASRVAAEGDAPTLGEVQALADELAPVPMRLSAPRWLARFRLHHRGVDRYRKGRAFVAGDAAHIHSPAGGQGMNTGIQDAENLAWKLALVAAGRGRAEPLLDSYHDERWPIGRNLLRYTDRLFALMATRNPLLLAVRSLVLPLVLPVVTRTRARQGRLFRFVSQLGIEYPWSRLVGGDAGPAGPGERAPDVVVRGAAGDVHLLDALAPPRLHLLAFSGLAPWTVSAPALLATARHAIAGHEPDVDVHLLTTSVTPPASGDLDGAVLADPSGDAHRRYGFSRPGLVVVRPDGHVGFRAAGLTAGAVAGHLAQLLVPSPPGPSETPSEAS